MESFFTYVLFSTVHNRIYVGHTNNLEKRIREHNSGKTKSTKGFLPYKLIYNEIHPTRKEAISREKFLKSGIGREFIRNELLKNH